MAAHAIRIEAHGGPEVLRYVEVDPPRDPSPGEAVVRQTAIGVNYIDTYHRTGLYPLALPGGLGVEAAGVLTALGEGAPEGLAVGDRVAYVATAPGAYATHRTVPAGQLVRLPEGVADETAAGGLLKGLTVEYLVRRTYTVRRGETVLLHAAAGGVGLLACQWLRHLGARVLGTVGSPEKAALARAHGCDEAILYAEEDVAARVRELTDGEGVPVVYDSVGRATLQGSLRSLKPRGLLVSFGNASGPPDPLPLGRLAELGSLYVTRPSLFAYIAARDELTEASAALFEVLESGALTVPVRQRWPLAEAAEAHRALEGRRTTGATVLIP